MLYQRGLVTLGEGLSPAEREWRDRRLRDLLSGAWFVAAVMCSWLLRCVEEAVPRLLGFLLGALRATLKLLATKLSEQGGSKSAVMDARSLSFRVSPHRSAFLINEWVFFFFKNNF